MKRILGAVLVLALWVGSLQAQGVTPGKEHAFLAESAGEWTVKFDSPDGESSTGKAVNKMAHGGLWLTSTLEMKMPTGDFTGQGLDSYDPVKKKYIGIWVDSMSASPINLEGDRSEDGKTLTMTGKGPGPDGKPTDYKTVTVYLDKNKHTFKLWMGDIKGEPMMSATYERVK
jgi:hypothetical protein